MREPRRPASRGSRAPASQVGLISALITGCRSASHRTLEHMDAVLVITQPLALLRLLHSLWCVEPVQTPDAAWSRSPGCVDVRCEWCASGGTAVLRPVSRRVGPVLVWGHLDELIRRLMVSYRLSQFSLLKQYQPPGDTHRRHRHTHNQNILFPS